MAATMSEVWNSLSGAGSTDGQGVPQTMAGILVGMLAFLAGLSLTLTPLKDAKGQPAVGRWLPAAETADGEKLAYERFAWAYTPLWISAFAVIVVGQLYEGFTANSYMFVCVGLCLPLFAFCFHPASSPNDPNKPITQRYAFKATVWLAIYSHIGNYWYTHYFYTVLRAKYTMPSWRLNDVPIPLYFATFFYFTTYHCLSNALLRRITSTYRRDVWRGLYLASVVLVLSYFTAFAETLTIASFPYYSFENRSMAYTVGSAFYGIYFIVSFPAFFRLDEFEEGKLNLYQTVLDACGAGMLILCLLDAVRLLLAQPLHIQGTLFSF